MKRLILLCGPGCCPACPEVLEDASSSEDKQIKIKDDFGNTISMSRSQFSVLIKGAKDGVLDEHVRS